MKTRYFYVFQHEKRKNNLKKLVVIQEGFTFALSKLKNKQSKPYGSTVKPEHMMNAEEIKTMEQLADYINKMNAEYDSNNVMDEAEAIAKKNGWSIGQKFPYVCYNDDERLMFENGKAEVHTKMKPEQVTTLELFADYINEREEWEDVMWDIMERNGWEETDDPNDVCQSDTELLIFGDNGAYVVPRHGCYHIYLSRHNSEDVPVADVDSIEEAKEWIASETEGLVKVDDEHNCSDDVFHSAKVCHYEVFVGDMVKVVDGEEEPNLNVVYQSEYYYNND